MQNAPLGIESHLGGVVDEAGHILLQLLFHPLRRVGLVAQQRTTDGGADNREVNAGISGDLAQHPVFDLRQAE